MIKMALCFALILCPVLSAAFEVNEQVYDTVIRLAGRTDEAMLAHLRTEAQAATGKTIVVTQGPGGDVKIGMMIAAEIRSRNYDTIVEIGSFCASACTISWFGGRQRYLSRFAPLLVHTVYNPTDYGGLRSKPGNDMVANFLQNLDVPWDVAYFLTAAGPDETLPLDPRAARSMGLDFIEY